MNVRSALSCESSTTHNTVPSTVARGLAKPVIPGADMTTGTPGAGTASDSSLMHPSPVLASVGPTS